MIPGGSTVYAICISASTIYTCICNIIIMVDYKCIMYDEQSVCEGAYSGSRDHISCLLYY